MADPMRLLNDGEIQRFYRRWMHDSPRGLSALVPRKYLRSN